MYFYYFCTRMGIFCFAHGSHGSHGSLPAAVLDYDS